MHRDAVVCSTPTTQQIPAASAFAQTQRCGSAEPRQPPDDRIPGERSSRHAPTRRCLWRRGDRAGPVRLAPWRTIGIARAARIGAGARAAVFVRKAQRSAAAAASGWCLRCTICCSVVVVDDTAALLLAADTIVAKGDLVPHRLGAGPGLPGKAKCGFPHRGSSRPSAAGQPLWLAAWSRSPGTGPPGWSAPAAISSAAQFAQSMSMR
jgi:hypothetical protein